MESDMTLAPVIVLKNLAAQESTPMIMTQPHEEAQTLGAKH
jgi:hypothetical protein